MAQRYRQTTMGPGARLPQLFVSIGCSLVAFTGVWLWWFGENIAGRVVRENDLTDPVAIQLWMERLHAFGSYGLAAVVVFMAIRAAIRHQAWRLIFLVLFLLFIGIGVWTGFSVDWSEARLWSRTVGGKVRAGLDLGDGPPLPDRLRRARVHLSIVPAAMLAVALMSFLHYRRS